MCVKGKKERKEGRKKEKNARVKGQKKEQIIVEWVKRREARP